MKMHGPENIKFKNNASCWLFSRLYHDARIHERHVYSPPPPHTLPQHILGYGVSEIDFSTRLPISEKR
jgi:hypothetical protein